MDKSCGFTQKRVKGGLRFGDTLGASGNTTHFRSKMTVTSDKLPKSNLVASSEFS